MGGWVKFKTFVNNRNTEIIRERMYSMEILISTSLVLVFEEVLSQECAHLFMFPLLKNHSRVIIHWISQLCWLIFLLSCLKSKEIRTQRTRLPESWDKPPPLIHCVLSRICRYRLSNHINGVLATHRNTRENSRQHFAKDWSVGRTGLKKVWFTVVFYPMPFQISFVLAEALSTVYTF